MLGSYIKTLGHYIKKAAILKILATIEEVVAFDEGQGANPRMLVVPTTSTIKCDISLRTPRDGFRCMIHAILNICIASVDTPSNFFEFIISRVV